MIKINLHIDQKLHNEVFLKIKEEIILIVIKIKNESYLDVELAKLKKVQFEPSKLIIRLFCSNNLNKKEIKKKIKNNFIVPTDLINLKAIARFICPRIFTTNNYLGLVHDLSPICLSDQQALEIIKIMTI